MTELDVRKELAQIVSRFGVSVCPSEVPDSIIEKYIHGLTTGHWYLKTPQDKDRRLVLRAIAGINASVDARSVREKDVAACVLRGAVESPLPETIAGRFSVQHSGDEIQIVLVRYLQGRSKSSLIDTITLDQN